MTNSDDRLDQKLSETVDILIENPYLTKCYRSKIWPDNIKCIMPKTISNQKTQCQKVFEMLNMANAWFYCAKEDDKVLIIIQKKFD